MKYFFYLPIEMTQFKTHLQILLKMFLKGKTTFFTFYISECDTNTPYRKSTSLAT